MHIEFSKKLGSQPLFAIEACNGELVFDMPYYRTIFTPAAKLKNEQQASCDEKRDTDITTDVTRNTKN